jgi:hypothetical protein
VTTRQAVCPCGQRSVEYAHEGQSVGWEQEQTGFKFVMRHDGGSIWLCPICLQTARYLANRLAGVMGTSSFHFPALVDKDKR